MVRRIDHDCVDRARLHRRRAADDHLRHRSPQQVRLLLRPTLRCPDRLVGQGQYHVRGIDPWSGGYGPITETTAQAAPLIVGLGVGLAFRAGSSISVLRVRPSSARSWPHTSASRGICHLAYTSCWPPSGAARRRILGRHRGLAESEDWAHEVIVTIMMNYIALGLLAYLLTTPAFQRPGRTDPISPSWTGTPPCHD